MLAQIRSKSIRGVEVFSMEEWSEWRSCEVVGEDVLISCLGFDFRFLVLG